MCTRFDSAVNSHTSTLKLVTTLLVRLYIFPIQAQVCAYVVEACFS